uniref:Uncharacterized protein n=1 Tax=Stomoxys calcitrans TaxID=35570 RepID=A0A1I8PGV1_STOCA
MLVVLELPEVMVLVLKVPAMAVKKTTVLLNTNSNTMSKTTNPAMISVIWNLAMVTSLLAVTMSSCPMVANKLLNTKPIKMVTVPPFVTNKSTMVNKLADVVAITITVVTIAMHNKANLAVINKAHKV